MSSSIPRCRRARPGWPSATPSPPRSVCAPTCATRRARPGSTSRRSSWGADVRAAVMRGRRLVVADVPTPAPGPGDVLVRTLACGICGSDLHALKHAEQFVEVSRRAGAQFPMDLARDVVMGHEFCAEIVEHGPGTAHTLPVGTRVCSRPTLTRAT